MATLEKIGFRSKWRSWMQFCLSTVPYSVLFNGEASGFFSSIRGLRQRDPLSPFFFILVLETLNRLVNKKAIDVGFLEGFQVTNAGLESMLISHLLFVDDTLFLCKPNESNLGYLRCILLLFETMSGLKVHLAKSVRIPIREVPEPHHLGQFFGYGVDFLPLEMATGRVGDGGVFPRPRCRDGFLPRPRWGSVPRRGPR